MSADAQDAPLWAYIPTSEFTPPQSTVRQAVRTGIMGFFQRLFEAEEEAEPMERELATLADEELALLAATPDWTAAVPALQDALQGWLKADTNAGAGFVVGLPQSGNEATLRALAEALSWRVIEPPDEQDILGKDESWFAHFGASDEPWVLPTLELCYLRHVGGLWLVRALLDRVACGELGRGLIGCDAWSWTYLEHVWSGNRSPAWVLRPFGEDELARWLVSLPGDTALAPIFRDGQSGAAVFPSETAASETAPAQKSTVLRDIAHYSRGCPGVALAIWRRMLRSTPEAEETTPDGADDAHQEQVIWVAPLDQCTPAAISPVARSERALVLQTLLLHTALSAETLEQLVPMSLSGTIQTLSTLQQMGHLQLSEGRWSVCPHALPVVRQFLEDKGHLVDAF